MFRFIAINYFKVSNEHQFDDIKCTYDKYGMQLITTEIQIKSDLRVH